MDRNSKTQTIMEEEDTKIHSSRDHSLQRTQCDANSTIADNDKKYGNSGYVKNKCLESSEMLMAPADSKSKKSAKKPYPKGIPDTNFGLAVMVALCFNLPFGVLAIYLSLAAAKAYVNEHRKKGALRARLSMIASLFGIVITVVVVVSLVLWSAMTKKKNHS